MLKLVIASPKKELVRNAVIILREKIPNDIKQITNINQLVPDRLYYTVIYLKKYNPYIWKVCHHPEISYAFLSENQPFNKDELFYKTVYSRGDTDEKRD